MAVPDGGCPASAQGYMASLITIPVSWPATMSSGVKVTTAGTGSILLVTLATEMTAADAGAFTGTSRTCAITLPPVAFDPGANAIVGVTSGNTGYLSISLPDSLWDKITRTSPISGTSTGLNPGAMVSTSASVSGIGLAPTSSFLTSMAAWPTACASNCTPTGAFMASDLTANAGDDDGDGNPGVTALGVKMTTGKNQYILPPLAAIAGGSADQIYIVTRTALSITSTRLDCNTEMGTANVTLFDNHVVGCHVSGGGACNSTQVSFLDTNRVVYTLTGGATVKTKTITGKANPTCVDARAAIGFTG